MISTASDERYEVVVKHVVKGVLHMGSFKTFEQALNYLRDSWATLNIERHLTQINCSGAIYDKYDSGSRVFLIGAPYLTDERLRHRPSANQKKF
jgi:hypothetical protein